MHAPPSGLRIRRNEPRARTAAFAGAALLLVCLAARAQPPSDTLDAAALDRERVAFLTANGVRAATSRAVVWVPPDTLSHDEAQALAETLAGGVEAIDEFLHAPRPWQRPPGAVEYYFHPAMFISHANAVESRVFISFPRIADGTAAFLHETTHALLFPSQSFLATYEGEEEEVPWLVEGLPTYVAKAVAEQTGFAEGNPFPIGSIEEIDATCARALATPVRCRDRAVHRRARNAGWLELEGAALGSGSRVLRVRSFVQQIPGGCHRHRRSRRPHGGARRASGYREARGQEHGSAARRMARTDRRAALIGEATL